VSVAWDDDPVVAAWGGLPPLDGDRTADICVVGLGASGLAAVRAGVDRGLSVIGIEAGRMASGAAGRNGGFLLGGPAKQLHCCIESWGVEAALWLYRETLAELDALEAELGAGVVRRVGSLRLAGLPGEASTESEAEDRVAELADCALEAMALAAVGIPVEVYDGSLGRGNFMPLDAAVNPARRAVETAQALRGRASLHEYTAATAIGAGQVVTTAGVISAGAIVVAVDGRLETLLPELAGRSRTTRLQMLATEPVSPGRLPCPVYGRWGYDYAQQDASGRLYVGGGRDRFVDAEWTTDPEPTDEVQGYIESVAARMAGQPVSVTHRWGASVGYTEDGRALCTEVADGVVACGGYNGTGNLVGPVAARAALALALDATSPNAAFAR
jgi:gamma-glutamylputrescine oxidase